MVRSSFVAPLRRTLLAGAAAAASLGALMPAQAAFYVGNWDPPYDPINGLYWRGSTTVFVPQSCVITTGLVTNNGACGGVATVQAATVDFSLTTSPLSTYETLVFDPTSLTISSFQYLGGILIGINTNISDSEPGVVSGPSFGIDFSLQLQTGTLVFGNGSLPYSNALLYNDSDGSDGEVNTIPALVRFAQIPEPTALLLAGSALGLLGLARRRRRPAPAPTA